jgi:hypothetical protein
MLSDQKERLVRALRLKDDSLATMYLGALRVLSDESNADRLSLAAHGLRELMEKIPRRHNFPVQRKDGRKSLKEMVQDLYKEWNSTLERTACLHAPRWEPVEREGRGWSAPEGDAPQMRNSHLVEALWQGEIDEAITSFLTETRIFFAKFAKDFPGRRDEFATALHQLDRSRVGIPAPLENQNIKGWMKLHEYFTSVCHHGKKDLGKFSDMLTELEELLLARLCPSTVADFDEIDNILAEAADAD